MHKYPFFLDLCKLGMNEQRFLQKLKQPKACDFETGGAHHDRDTLPNDAPQPTTIIKRIRHPRGTLVGEQARAPAEDDGQLARLSHERISRVARLLDASYL